ncbi:hypothetical protein KC19_9G067800 [Ceratodon purpureus]|uniref:NAD-dependent epimerase/dehydratase domain-containing protein n=1 Tax=Ceratodon purpureus TaxID=3225 RepID=A0A8T0GRC7_CERPU|nr:hypothetical protein KC19_9G067800 [Ceratodon purpureus]
MQVFKLAHPSIHTATTVSRKLICAITGKLASQKLFLCIFFEVCLAIMGSIAAPAETVCVTGASGFIASWIVKILLESGYNVKGTVRNPENAKHLLKLPGADDRLQLIAADICTPSVFDSIFEGCDGVFHTSTPTPGAYDAASMSETGYIETAVKGTLNVLESCAKLKRPLKRLVLTSSMAAVHFSKKLTPDSVIDETFFSDPEVIRNLPFLGEDFKSYVLSKTYAEKAAWDFVEEHKNLNMVSINPVMVMGPTLQGTVNSTNSFPLDFLSGELKTIPNAVRGWIGVKDCAMAHILAYEKPEAHGRYIVSESTLHFADLAAVLRKLFPNYKVEAREDVSKPRAPMYAVSTERVKELGLVVEPLEDVLKDTVECFISLGRLKPYKSLELNGI